MLVRRSRTGSRARLFSFFCIDWAWARSFKIFSLLLFLLNFHGLYNVLSLKSMRNRICCFLVDLLTFGVYRELLLTWVNLCHYGFVPFFDGSTSFVWLLFGGLGLVHSLLVSYCDLFLVDDRLFFSGFGCSLFGCGLLLVSRGGFTFLASSLTRIVALPQILLVLGARRLGGSLTWGDSLPLELLYNGL